MTVSGCDPLAIALCAFFAGAGLQKYANCRLVDIWRPQNKTPFPGHPFLNPPATVWSGFLLWTQLSCLFSETLLPAVNFANALLGGYLVLQTILYIKWHSEVDWCELKVLAKSLIKITEMLIVAGMFACMLWRPDIIRLIPQWLAANWPTTICLWVIAGPSGLLVRLDSNGRASRFFIEAILLSIGTLLIPLILTYELKVTGLLRQPDPDLVGGLVFLLSAVASIPCSLAYFRWRMRLERRGKGGPQETPHPST